MLKVGHVTPVTVCLAIAAFGLCLSLSSPLYAKPEHAVGSQHGKHGQTSAKQKYKKRSGPSFGKSDRLVLADFLKEKNASFCPPGLAKKNNGCLPPEQAKKFKRGDILDDSIEWETLPEEILKRLRPPATGTSYVMANQNVLLISEATKKILDAVTLSSGTR